MLCLRIFFVLFIEKPIYHCTLPLNYMSINMSKISRNGWQNNTLFQRCNFAKLLDQVRENSWRMFSHNRAFSYSTKELGSSDNFIHFYTFLYGMEGSIDWRQSFYRFCLHSKNSTNCIKTLFYSDSFVK